MKQIKITPANAEKINQAIAAVEGRATARTGSYGLVEAAIEAAEAHPALAGTPKKDWVGTQASYQPVETFPNAYKWTPYGTRVRIVRRASGWFFEGADRRPVPSSQPLYLWISQELADEYIARQRRTFNVLTDTTANANAA